jgi:uncharacterized protein (DUF927 family)
MSADAAVAVNVDKCEHGVPLFLCTNGCRPGERVNQINTDSDGQPREHSVSDTIDAAEEVDSPPDALIEKRTSSPVTSVTQEVSEGNTPLKQDDPNVDHVDFRAVRVAARQQAKAVVERYLPGGHWEGREYVVRNPTRNDNREGSFKIRDDGVWGDFALNDESGDLIDLVAMVKGKSKLEAARELRDFLNVRPSSQSTSLIGNIRPQARRKLTSRAAMPVKSHAAPESFPPRTAPDQSGKPRFSAAGDEGPPVRDDEKRRHVYHQGGIPVRIKIIQQNSAVYNVYRVTDSDGSPGWQYKKPDGFEAVPYFVGSDPFGVSSEQPIFWPEGEKDVEALQGQGLLAFSFGGTGDGLPAGCHEYVRGRDVVVLADNDDAGREHAEKKAAIAHGSARGVRIVHFADTSKGGDVSDWLLLHDLSELLKRVEAAPIWQPQTATEQSQDEPEAEAEEGRDRRVEQKSSLPPGYSFSDRGLMWSNPDDPDKPPVLVAGHFDILAETRDGDGASWGVLLHWQDHDGRDHRFALPRATLAGDGSDARKILMDGGLYIAPSQKARALFNSFLLQVKSPNRARATQRVGWHGQSFVLPDDCFGMDARDVLLLQSVSAHEHSFRQSGTLESWQEKVGQYAIGNSRLILALSIAFAAPLIGRCSAEGGGIHFKGASSTGKTTALLVAGSAWGGGAVANGYVRSWRATANGLEGVALGHCDALLCLDELSQLAAKEAGEVAYMLANGSGKSRSSRDGSARRAAQWRSLFLSSGEFGLADKVAEDGRRRKLAAGQQIRIVDISADAGAGMGMFEELHGFSSAEALARHLRAAAQEHYGVAARAFLAEIVPNIDEVQKVVANVVSAFCDQYVPNGADGQVRRVAQRFGLIAAGGELAKLYGIAPWERGAAVAACGRCFTDWLEIRGDHGAAENRAAIDQVRSFLLAHGTARFVPAWEKEDQSRVPIRDVAGYRRKVDDGWDYYATTSAWKEEICAGIDPRRTATLLKERGYTVCGDGPHIARSVRVPGHDKLRLYHIRSSFLEDDREA